MVTWINRSSPPEVFLLKGVLKICRKFKRKYPWRSVISIKLRCNFIEIALHHGCSHANLLHISRTFFLRTPLVTLFLNKEVSMEILIIHLFDILYVLFSRCNHAKLKTFACLCLSTEWNSKFSSESISIRELSKIILTTALIMFVYLFIKLI